MRLTWTAGVAALTAGCASSRAVAPPDVRPAPPAEAASASTAAPSPSAARPTAFAWVPGARRLVVRTVAEITREPAAPGEAPEQTATAVFLTDTLAIGADAAGGVRAAGVVDSVVVTASARVLGDPSAAAPRLGALSYQAASDARGVRVDPAPGAGVDLRCTAPAGATALAALAAVREALPRVPDGAAPGARWRDTTVTARCAGPVLVVVQTVSRYEAAPALEGGLLVVVRRSTSTLAGRGSAGVRPVAVAGSGQGELRYRLDPARGLLAGAAGEGRTSLTVTVAGAAQRFAQRTRTEVAAAESAAR